MKTMIIAAVLATALTGCAHTEPGSTAPARDFGVEVNPHYVELPDGRTVLCVYEGNQYSQRSGGPSCDWINAK